MPIYCSVLELRLRRCVGADAPPSSVSQGPEIRTGTLKDGKPVQLVAGQEVTITTDYTRDGDEKTIAMR